MSRSRRDTHSLLLAGWLFADLLAMLFVISLASQTMGGAAAAEEPSASPSAGPSAHSSPSPGTKPSTGPSPGPSQAAKIGLDPHWLEVDVTHVDYNALQEQGPDGKVATDIVNQMSRALNGAPGGARQVGFVATFTQTPKNVSLGDDISDLVNSVLFKHHPQFTHTTGLNLWQAGVSGTIQVKVFFFNQ